MPEELVPERPVNPMAQELRTKMTGEQEFFHHWIGKQPTQTLISRIPEYAMRQAVLHKLDFDRLTEEQTATLLKSATPLGNICRCFDPDNISELVYRLAIKCTQKDGISIPDRNA